MKSPVPVEDRKAFSQPVSISKVHRLFVQIVWVGIVLLLPLTSLPLLVELSGATTVAPPSNVLLLLLALVWLFPYLLRKGKLPKETFSFLFFLVVVLISVSAAIFWGTPVYRGQNYLNEAPQAMITFVMAATAYFVAAAWLLQDRENLNLTLKLINLSGLFLLVWSVLQAGYVLFANSNYPPAMVQLQGLLVSGSNPLFGSRVNGFAYEPSWLAHQLNMVYLPVWLAATLTGYSAHRFRLVRVSIENILLLGGVFVLIMSVSRVGWLSFLLVTLYVAVNFTLRMVGKFSVYIQNRPISSGGVPKESKLIKLGLSLTLFTSFLILFVILIAGLIYLGSRVDPRIERIIQTNPLKSGDRWLSFYEVTNQLAFAERVVYWHSGWQIFNDHPILGVGLGNAGFYFKENMPAFGWGLTEVAVLLNRLDHIPNTKAIWARLVAETGLIGLAAFLGWLFIQWKSARLVVQSKEPILRMAGLAGHLVLVGFIIEGFSVDSFALPYFWFSMGVLSASGGLARNSFRFLQDRREVLMHG
jgi:hypothetical protein